VTVPAAKSLVTVIHDALLVAALHSQPVPVVTVTVPVPPAGPNVVLVGEIDYGAQILTALTLLAEVL
jgi:hypothetical protein